MITRYRLTRRLHKPNPVILEDDGMAIARYIGDLDHSIKRYLAESISRGIQAPRFEKVSAEILKLYGI